MALRLYSRLSGTLCAKCRAPLPWLLAVMTTNAPHPSSPFFAVVCDMCGAKNRWAGTLVTRLAKILAFFLALTVLCLVLSAPLAFLVMPLAAIMVPARLDGMELIK